MEIKDFLSPADVLTEVHAPNKVRLLHELAKRAASTVALHADRIAEALLKREELGSTGLGGGIAIPHARSVCKLRRAVQLIVPERDVAWLREIENDLGLVMHPRSKYDRLILAEVLVEAGLTLMAEAEAAVHLTELRRARQFRNGLMVALLACCPIRLKNFAALEIGRSFIQNGNDWWIVLAASETKEGRPDERPIPEFLKAGIQGYVSRYRCTLARSGDTSMALWLSSNDGKPMSYSAVECVISQTTKATVGVTVSPHLFRTSAATSAAIHGGDMPGLGSAVLHHSDQSVTERHYNCASSLSAGKHYLELVGSYRNIG